MIEIDRLEKAYGEHRVLQGVSLRVERGEVVCLIGPSGSGKSTVLRCINGLESYQGGHIDVAGLRLEHDGPRLHQRPGVVPGRRGARLRRARG